MSGKVPLDFGLNLTCMVETHVRKRDQHSVIVHSVQLCIC